MCSRLVSRLLRSFRIRSTPAVNLTRLLDNSNSQTQQEASCLDILRSRRLRKFGKILTVFYPNFSKNGRQTNCIKRGGYFVARHFLHKARDVSCSTSGYCRESGDLKWSSLVIIAENRKDIRSL